ncbi:SRPBCC family protein [Pelagerythrobacter rhizovicinus]|uniref:SRPBCC family protein n=1 Tax=Pelagerythrobacter rhizovicinus TaxID=2268576 RepID=UPI00177DF887|nr:SRPBCC family protein [Pelagerythrobacter rhizovicinus]
MPKIRMAMLAMAAGAAALAPATVAAKVVKQDAAGFVTRDTVVVEATPRETWMALISPAKWWNEAHTWSGDAANLSLTPQAGGCFCERIPEVETRADVGLAGSAQHMIVVHAAPDRALRMRGALGPLQSEAVTGVLTIALAQVEQGTAITFEYVVGGYMRYEVPPISQAVDGVMSQQLAGLAALLGPVDAPAEEKAAGESADAKPADEADPPDDESDVPPAKKPSVEDAFGDLSDGA